MNSERRDAIQQIMNIKTVDGHAIYLGLPTFLMKNKRLQFGYICDRILRRLDSWKHKILSAGGKEILIKTVLQAIPTYTMACFKLPKNLLYEINRTIARFWWGDTVDKSTIHWVK